MRPGPARRAAAQGNRRLGRGGITVARAPLLSREFQRRPVTAPESVRGRYARLDDGRNARRGVTERRGAGLALALAASGLPDGTRAVLRPARQPRGPRPSAVGCSWPCPLTQLPFPSARISCTRKLMARQKKSVHKKSRGRGRPPGQQYGETIPVRLTPMALEAIDAWAKGEDVSRSEAIRRLIDRALRPQRRKQ